MRVKIKQDLVKGYDENHSFGNFNFGFGSLTEMRQTGK